MRLPMTISVTLEEYLQRRHIRFDRIPHPRSHCSSEAAEAAHISGTRLAKAVIVEDAARYLAVVVPASRHVNLTAVRMAIGNQCGLATEDEVAGIFSDCERGSIPAPAQAYGLDVLIDREMLGSDDVYLQSGDHRLLIRLDGSAFSQLMSAQTAGAFSETWPLIAGARASL
jgi:Ala-tRNA(Pro) deacylase